MGFWTGKTVLITGHTGFKGSWLSLWLQQRGARVIGYALKPLEEPNLFTIAAVVENMVSLIGDITDQAKLKEIMKKYQPDIVFHLAAQPLVRESYNQPVETYRVNLLGTVCVLESVRNSESVKVLINVTTDKCYENNEWIWPYRENDILGGNDPYSSSKACSELATKAYRTSFFKDGVQVATVRAGNVIGGGDWSKDRIVPDIIQSILKGQVPILRNPQAIRPWQHVLDPLQGYLILAEKMFSYPSQFDEAWNFGPSIDMHKTVGQLATDLVAHWNGFEKTSWETSNQIQPHEATKLFLDSSKARMSLGWKPKWDIDITIRKTIEWYKKWCDGVNMRRFTLQQIEQYEMSDLGNDKLSL